MRVTPADETPVSDDAGSTAAVVSMSRDPRRSRQVQIPNPVAASAPKTEPIKSEPPPLPPSKPEQSPREPVISVSVKPELPATPKSPPASTMSMVLPPVPAYQL